MFLRHHELQRQLVIRRKRNISEAILDNFDMSVHVEAVIESVPGVEEGGKERRAKKTLGTRSCG